MKIRVLGAQQRFNMCKFGLRNLKRESRIRAADISDKSGAIEWGHELL
jgi:hypothetical protein